MRQDGASGRQSRHATLDNMKHKGYEKVEHLVELFIVGQPKSGTTAIASQLAQNPDICVSSIKEPNYFATDLIRESDEFHGKKTADFVVRTPEQYQKLFDYKQTARVYGEASTAYLYSKEAANNIHAYNPDAKIIIFLREPVSLMHSLHMQYVNEANEDEVDFEKALQKEGLRKEGKYIPSLVRCPSYLHYSERVKYTDQTERYFKLFPTDNILIFTQDEYQRDNEAVYRKIVKHLGLSDEFLPEFGRVHDSRAPRIPWLNKIARHRHVRSNFYKFLGARAYTAVQKNVEKILFTKQPRKSLSADLEGRLRHLHLPEVRRISDFLNRDLIREWGYGE